MMLTSFGYCILGSSKRGRWNLKLVQKYDGKRRMASSYGCFWSSRRVCESAVSYVFFFLLIGSSIDSYIITIHRFTVEADRFIKDWTIITEYTGDVDYLRNREHDDGDSMMTLLSATNRSKSLVICPDKRSNIARFINGINNHTP